MEQQIQHPANRTAIRCKATHNLLGYRDEHGVYLLCKECRVEQFFAWSEIAPREPTGTHTQGAQPPAP